MERNENGLSALPEEGGSVGGVSEESSGADMNHGCTGCRGLGHRQLAMVYAPMQCFRMLYGHGDALMEGTLFEELNKPYEVEW